MNLFLRWQDALPRILLAVVLLLATQYGLGLALHGILIHTGEAVMGAKVELAQARVSFTGGQVDLHDLRIANPRQPMQNLLQFDHCALDMETSAFLHKHVVIHHGRVTGLQIATPRDTSGTLPKAELASDPFVLEWLGGQAAEQVQDWLKQLEEKFQRDVINQLESVRLTGQLVARWPQEYETIELKVKSLKQCGDDLQERFRAAQANPLRHIDFLAHLPKEIATLQKELVRLAAEVEHLPDRIDADRRAIVAARKHDEQLLRDHLHFDAIDSGAWAAYFLHEQLDGPLGELIRTVRWVRQIADAELQPADSARFHGENILFAGCRQAPDLLIRSLELQGSARVAGQGVDVRGLLRNLSSAPALHGEPTRLSLTASGAMPVELQATFDRTRATPRDEFLFTCQGVHLPAARLGQQENVRLAIAPTLASLHVTLLVEGDQLSGDIQLAQEQVKITPNVVGPLAEVPLAVALEDTLSNIHSIELHLSLTGTLDEPTCQLTSHFGPALAEAIGQALQRTAEQHTRVLLAESQQRVDQQLASLERRLAEQRAALLAPLNGSTTLLAQIASELKAAPGLTDERIGRQLPTNPLFR